MRARRILALVCALAVFACTSDDTEGTPESPPGDGPVDTGQAASTPSDSGQPRSGVVTYVGPDGRLFRIAATRGARPEDVGSRLEALGGDGEDDWINVAPDGSWLLVSSARFGCADVGACMVAVAADFTRADVVETTAGPQDYGELGAIASGGDLVVFPWSDGPHETDLWAMRRDGEVWDAPELLTGDSPHEYHGWPAVSEDGRAVVFNCGATAYGQERTGICRADIDAGGVEQLVGPQDGPGASPDRSARSADWRPGGGIVFEADWQGGEHLWRWVPGREPEMITPDFPNDNSPCVLPDGRVASLWLGRPDGAGHELKVMGPDGNDHELLVTGVDVMDVGLGCGGS